MVQNFFNRCIFCFRELREVDRKGRGDHMIPELLHGSLCVKDVCTCCNSKLGGAADHQVLEDARMISAVFELGLPELQAKIRERGAGKIIDSTDGSEAPVSFKNGIPRVVPQRISGGPLVCDEAEAERHLMNILRRNPPPGVDQDEMMRVVRENMIPKYNRLEPGGSVSEPTLGIRLRKSPGQIKQEWKVTEGACERLVAKIGYEIAFLVFDQDRLFALPILEELAAVAKGQGHLSESVLMYPISQYSPVNAPPHGPKCHHQIITWFEDVGSFVDIYFFGCVGFRLFLRGDSQAAHGPLHHPDGDLSMVSFLMTFDPRGPRRKFMHLKRVGSEQIEEYDGARAL